MLIITNAAGIYEWSQAEKKRGSRIGFVPTMGALHEGHLALVDAAKKDCGAVAVSIFVNPTQFGPNEDFSKYPRPIERDIELLQQRGVSAVYLPSPNEVYPAGYSTYVEPPEVASRWEGASRPGHYRGVCTVVLKLFLSVAADDAYFGQKDLQQCRVLQKMVQDFGFPIQLHVCPTIRESDGLALSSRNVYLSPAERTRALAISRSLGKVSNALSSGVREVQELENLLRTELTPAVDQFDYASIVDAHTLEPQVGKIAFPFAVIIAVKVGTTRLIDNRVYFGIGSDGSVECQ